MSSSALLGADASRPQFGILTPTSDGSLNRSYGDSPSAASESRKRKRTDSVAMDHLLQPAIALKPHPPNLHVQPRLLQPLMVLPRKHLALSYLDLTSPQGDLPPSRVFECHVKILDLESRMGSSSSVLIARHEPKGTCYALERQETNLYIACKLGSWVQLESLASHATALCEERIRPPKTEPQDTKPTTASTTPQTHKDAKKKRVAIEAIQSLVRKRGRSQSVSTFDANVSFEGTAGPQTEAASLPSSDAKPMLPSEPVHETQETQDVTPTQKEVGAAQQQTAQSIFDNIRVHYFEALYKSKGSLAYFAKGPLSRARSAFHLDLESNLDMNELIDFLKGLILTTVQIDKKYRETIPSLISKMATIIETSDEGRKKRRKSKKMKLGKDALYPSEDEKIQAWWSANKPELKEDETSIPTHQIKARASLLRTRETQLQMILIMEILALEELKPEDQTADSGLPSLPGISDTPGDMAPPSQPAKRRNKHNLPVLIDVHADRLTIWQSTAPDELLLLEDSEAPSSVNQNSQQKSTSDPLRDFCVDVIIPFYSSRLPQLSDSLSKKLGGPVIVSPPKPKHRSLKRAASKHEQRPGAATKRPAVRKEPRTLERAISFEQQHRRSVSRGPSQIADLMRATSATLPIIKREDSGASNLKNMAKADGSSSNHSRMSVSRSSSNAGLEDSKVAKKAKIDAELRDAISNLRKPNRGVVGKAMEEAAERKATTLQSAKKPKKFVKAPVGSGIQVKATPMKNRFVDVMGNKATTPADVPLPSTEDRVPPSSIGPFVPSTATRHGHKDVMQSSASPAMDAVAHTPLKPSTGASFLRRPTREEPAIPPSSPIMTRKAAPMESPLVPASVYKPMSKPSLSSSRYDDIPETPIKKSAPPPAMTKEQGAQGGRKGSIYQALGWDDDDYDLDDLL